MDYRLKLSRVIELVWARCLTGQAKLNCFITSLSDMIASMELQRPRVTPVLPQWDLGIVLEGLSRPPYEPLREVSLKHLTLESVFLLAMASAGRCSGLQALVFDQKYIYSSNLRGLVLRYILEPSSCERIRNEIKAMTPGMYQRFLLASQSLALLTAL